MNRPPTGREVIRSGVAAVVVVAVIALVLVLTPVLELRQAVPLFIAYAVAVTIVTTARWFQARAARG